MSQYESKDELRDKIDYEGGLTEAVYGYGINSLDLPEGTPLYVRDAWKRLEGVKRDVDRIEDWLWS